MSATTVHSKSTKLNILGRYTVPDESRVLIGRRIENEVYVYDYPDGGNGRRYFVEKGFESKVELALLIADYRRRAQRLGACPMSREGTEHALELSALT
jgi:bifunctional DNA-binding transcriptional regulator/antitoxin component of YhaV-PrlF toxin-antitoxin module